ncbi:isopentenyl-diphosphate Delta-isomerase [uncultured Odoribacter sp.]|uniref:isopentenyl-diphosphate Delta-isomerase n=1 Tax=uncultured Odoribacter sp. TaxID=876416 RepID=UPI0026119D49|nr:isopentenyl-diphosphate Delta-isomerase [uncultured Odoribacter sp.]
MEYNTPNATQVILVDINDQPIGTMDKLEAHRRGFLHRAVLVFVFNHKGEWLLQRRTAFKYHSGGLWSNTCSTHPHPGEVPLEAAQRRLQEEMGLKCSLEKSFCFTYKAKLDHGVTEYEYEHVFTGFTENIPDVNPLTVWDWKYLPLDIIRLDERIHPEKYTVWFRQIYREVLQHQKQKV